MENSSSRQEPVEQAGRRIELQGSSVLCQESGSGGPVVLVHGWGGSGYDWTRLSPYLSDDYRVLAPDLPGFGKSDKPDIDYTLDYYVNLIRDFAAAMDASRFHLVGHSMGGQIAAAFALHHPDKLLSLVLLDPAGVSRHAPRFYRLARRQWLVYLALRFMPLAFFKFWFKRFGPYYDSTFLTPEDMKGHYHSYGNKEGARAAARCFKNIIANPEAWLDNRLSEIETPVLLVWGREDPLLPLGMSEAFAQGLPGARLAVLDKCGHCPHEEKPEVLAGLCIRHFSRAFAVLA